jgi:hypothetical protein
MDKYHETHPPSELKSVVMGREGSKKNSEKAPVFSEKPARKMSDTPDKYEAAARAATRFDRLLRHVSLALAREDLSQASNAKLSDEAFEALQDLHERIHKRVLNTGKNWIEKNFGAGTWELVCQVGGLVLSHEQIARHEKSPSSLEFKLSKLLDDDDELEYYKPFALRALDSIAEFDRDFPEKQPGQGGDSRRVMDFKKESRGPLGDLGS